MFKQVTSLALSALIVGGSIWAWVQRDYIFDEWRLHGYTAPAEVDQLATATTMKPSARRLFYVYRPSLEGKTAFNSHCGKAEQTIVLGCYIQHQGIYLYNVPDARLKGVVEVTAAHEMLHAAYDRLDSKERARVDVLTAQVAASITDPRLKQTIENYRKADPSSVPNELHSILGTEVRNLPNELELHYAKYFTNRGAIVSFADAYKQVFTEREQQVATYDGQLASLKPQIDSLNATLETQQTSLKAQFENLQQLKRTGNVNGYNTAVPGYNQQVATYNTNVNRQKQLVAQYNTIVDQRNAIAVEENQLSKSLDSRSTIQNQY